MNIIEILISRDYRMGLLYILKSAIDKLKIR